MISKDVMTLFLISGADGGEIGGDGEPIGMDCRDPKDCGQLYLYQVSIT